jgi:DNA-binding NarL/FixJ family response regulator
MKMRPQRTLLRKIEARRGRTGYTQPRLTWAAVLASASGETGRWGRNVSVAVPRILTPRELEVLLLVARGETDQGIADRLFLSRRTVNSHVSNILAKLDVPSRTAAVIAAARIGLL